MARISTAEREPDSSHTVRFTAVLQAYAATERTLAHMLSRIIPSAYTAAADSLRLANEAQGCAEGQSAGERHL